MLMLGSKGLTSWFGLHRIFVMTEMLKANFNGENPIHHQSSSNEAMKNR